MGAQSVAGIYHYSCQYPCRLCRLRRDSMWNLVDASKACLRDSDESKVLLEGSLEAYCKDARCIAITEQAKSKLRKLKRRKLHPVENALFTFDLPHPSLTWYLLTPADLLHTMLSGLFRDWIVCSEVISKHLVI